MRFGVYQLLILQINAKQEFMEYINIFCLVVTQKDLLVHIFEFFYFIQNDYTSFSF